MPLNPTRGPTGPAGPTGPFDTVSGDARWVNVAGDTLTGQLVGHTTAPFKLPNGAWIVGRNVAGSADLNLARFNSADALSLYNDALVIDSAGKIGVGDATPDYQIDVETTFETAAVALTSAGYSSMYNLGAADPNFLHAGFWPQPARMGFTVARKFSSGGAIDGPTCSLTAHMDINQANADSTPLMSTGRVMIANGHVWGSNLCVMSDNVAGAKLVGLEVDVVPFAGTTPSSQSGGIFINCFNANMPNVPALFTGATSGSWGFGLLINGIHSGGAGVAIQAGASSMAWGIHLNNGTYGTSAAKMGAQNDKPALVLNQGVSGTTANILEVKSADDSHTFFTVTGGNAGNWVSKSKASTDHVSALDATSVGQNVGVILRSAGVDKWTIYKDGADAFFIYSAAAAGPVIGMGAGATRALGFFGATPVARASAYTQTYATADKTHANPTATSLTAASGTADGTVADVGAAFSQTTLNNNFKDVSTAINANIVDIADVKQLINAVVDDLQAYGLFQ